MNSNLKYWIGKFDENAYKLDINSENYIKKPQNSM